MVGRTGSGKSTLAVALSRLCPLEARHPTLAFREDGVARGRGTGGWGVHKGEADDFLAGVIFFL